MPKQVSTELNIQARAALTSRRYPPALLKQLDALDEPSLRTSAWVALFQGRRLCRLHSRFPEATALINHALAIFRSQEDHEGLLWALAEWVVMRYHAADFMTGLTEIAPFLNHPMRPYLRAELLFGKFLCLIGMSRVRESVLAGTQALAQLDIDPDPWLQRVGRIQMLRNIAASYHYLGEMRQAISSAQRAAALAEEDPDTADMRPWCYYELGLAYWRQGQLQQATETLDIARRMAETWQHRELWRWAVAAQGHILRDQDRLDAALAAYQLANCWGEDPDGPAFIQLRQGRLAEARWSCDVRLALVRSEGGHAVGDTLMLQGLIELKSGRPRVALDQFDQALEIYTHAEHYYYQATAQLYRAAVGLALDQETLAITGLSAFLSYAAREQVLTCAWWMPDVIEQLLLYAAQHQIEVEWAQQLLGARFAGPSALSFLHPTVHNTAELEIAQRMQRSLLPTLPPVMPDLDIAALVLPAAEIGGDFVGYFPYGASLESATHRQIGIAIGDISGKGLGAALLLSGTVVALNTVASEDSSPAQVATALHEAMRPYTSRSRMNIAFCYALLKQHTANWSMHVTGAGAIAPLLRRANGDICWLETTGFPLGTLFNATYQETSILLQPNDLLILMSDGIIEAMDEERHLFGFDRVAQVVADLAPHTDAHSTLQAIITAIHQYTHAAEQHDDITIVVVRVLAGMAAQH